MRPNLPLPPLPVPVAWPLMQDASLLAKDTLRVMRHALKRQMDRAQSDLMDQSSSSDGFPFDFTKDIMRATRQAAKMGQSLAKDIVLQPRHERRLRGLSLPLIGEVGSRGDEITRRRCVAARYGAAKALLQRIGLSDALLLESRIDSAFCKWRDDHPEIQQDTAASFATAIAQLTLALIEAAPIVHSPWPNTRELNRRIFTSLGLATALATWPGYGLPPETDDLLSLSSDVVDLNWHKIAPLFDSADPSALLAREIEQVAPSLLQR